MKPRSFAALSIVLLCSAGCLRVEAASSPFAIYLEFDQDPPSVPLAVMKSEVASILAPAAFHPVWRDPATRRDSEDFPVLMFARFHGDCRAEALPSNAPQHLPHNPDLAATAVVSGRVLPFADVQCSEVRRFLESSLRFAADPETLLGRALGRILAHEAFHFLAATTDHGKKGVARAAYRRQDLTAKQLVFDDPEIARLRAISGRLEGFREMAARAKSGEGGGAVSGGDVAGR